jgi:hypothetical protein
MDIEMLDRAQPGPATDRRAQSGDALRGFFCLAATWKLNVREQMTLLGLTAPSTYFQWKKRSGTTLPKDTLERISYLVRIDTALRTLSAESPYARLRQPNQVPLFGGCSVLQRMLVGNVADLFEVQRNFDALSCGAGDDRAISGGVTGGCDGL